MTITPDFIIQSLTVLIPAIVTIAVTAQKQNAKIAAMQSRITELETENEELRERFDKLSAAHADLQTRYEETLKAQANMRGKF